MYIVPKKYRRGNNMKISTLESLEYLEKLKMFCEGFSYDGIEYEIEEEGSSRIREGIISKTSQGWALSENWNEIYNSKKRKYEEDLCKEMVSFASYLMSLYEGSDNNSIKVVKGIEDWYGKKYSKIYLDNLIK